MHLTRLTTTNLHHPTTNTPPDTHHIIHRSTHLHGPARS